MHLKNVQRLAVTVFLLLSACSAAPKTNHTGSSPAGNLRTNSPLLLNLDTTNTSIYLERLTDAEKNGNNRAFIQTDNELNQHLFGLKNANSSFVFSWFSTAIANPAETNIATDLDMSRQVPNNAPQSSGMSTPAPVHCDAKLYMAEHQPQDGKADLTLFAACSAVAKVSITYEVIAEELEDVTTFTKYSKSLSANVGPLFTEVDHVADVPTTNRFAYKVSPPMTAPKITAMDGRSVLGKFSGDIGYVNKRGSFYPRYSEGGRLAVPFPLEGSFHPDNSADLNGDAFRKTCLDLYAHNGWAYTDTTNFENLHIKPLRWGGSNMPNNCYRLAEPAHQLFTAWWADFETGQSH